MNLNNNYPLNQIVFLLVCFLGTSMSVAQTSLQVNIMDFGANANGKTLNTKAIDHCYKNGRRTVEFLAGTYLTGTIVLKDNFLLNLQAGSKILGSTNIRMVEKTMIWLILMGVKMC